MTLRLTYSGFNYVADVDGSYADADSLPDMIAQTDSNAVALTDDYGINAHTNTVYADTSTSTATGNTETLADVGATTREAIKDGLSVMVRPLIDFTADATTTTLTGPAGTYADGDWRADYNPGSTARGIAFLESYRTLLVAQAKEAQADGAQLLDVGTELDQLTGPAYQAEWTKIITAVRAVYSGKLTYSAIGDDDLSPWQYGPGTAPAAGTGDITTQVSFWSQLDYVGIDEYSALANATPPGGADPTYAQLVAAWEQAPPPNSDTAAQTGGKSLVQYYTGVAAALGKPLLFTEIGFNSAPDAASQPFYTSSGTYDPTLQTDLYRAFFQAWQDQVNPPLQGVYLWNWEPDPSTVGAGSTPSWTPQGNTGALQAVRAANMADTAACYCPGTRIGTRGGETAIEDLVVGDLVITASGAERPVRWIGVRSYAARWAAARPHLRPVLIPRCALGNGLPWRDLRVSPRHAMLLDGWLVAAEDLVGAGGIRRETGDGDIRYIHLELETHDVILAEGAPAETFLDDDSRGMFQNAATAPAPGAEHRTARFCAPHLVEGAALERIRGRIGASRAA